MSGALCHGLCVGVRKHLVSVNYRTNAWVDWSDFSVAFWGWLEEGSFRWSAPPLIQDGRVGFDWSFHLILEKKRLIINNSSLLMCSFSVLQCLQFHPNSNYIVTGSCDRSIRLWDILSGNCVRLLTGHKVRLTGHVTDQLDYGISCQGTVSDSSLDTR
jgi:WD40 repeat protein